MNRKFCQDYTAENAAILTREENARNEKRREAAMAAPFVGFMVGVNIMIILDALGYITF